MERKGHISQSGLNKELALYCTPLATDITKEIIDEVVKKRPLIFMLEDILCHVPISTLTDAQILFDVLSEVFVDADSDWEKDDEPFFELIVTRVCNA